MWYAYPPPPGVESPLPKGLTMDPNTGVISGTPTSTASWPFQIMVSDDYGPAFRYIAPVGTPDGYLIPVNGAEAPAREGRVSHGAGEADALRLPGTNRPTAVC